MEVRDSKRALPNMPMKRFLSQEQQKGLQKALRENDCPYFQQRVMILLLRNDGKTYQQIADLLGCSYRTVVYWCVHGEPDNLDTLKDNRKLGNFRKADEAYIQMLMEVIEKEPSELGYEFDRWTGERLAAHLEEKTGIKLSSASVRRIIQKKKPLYLRQGKRRTGRRRNVSKQTHKEPIIVENRRLEKERRIRDERRKSDVKQRLRVGLLKNFNLADSLLNEASGYEFVSQKNAQECEASQVLNEAIHAVCNSGKDDFLAKAKYVVEAVAEYVNDSYEVKMVERRHIADRRSDSQEKSIG